MDDTKYTGDLWGNDNEVSTQETTPAPSEQNVQPVETSRAMEEVHNDTPTNANPTPQESFSAIRAKAEKLQRERDEAFQRLQKIEQYAVQQQLQQQYAQQYKQPEPEPEPLQLDDDDYIEGKHFKQEINHLKKQLSQFQQQQQSTSIELQLRNKYPDFDRVMTYENISKLRELKPEVAASLHQSHDLYNKAAATYSILKDMGIGQEGNYNPERERAEQNTSKPRVASSLQKTESALTHASEFSGSKLTDARKKEIYAQMQRNSR